MGLPQINALPAVPGQLNANFRVPSLDNAGPLPALTSHRSIGRIQVRTTPSDLRIDSTEARESMGYRSMLSLLRNGWQYTMRQAERGVAHIVSDGERMKHVETGENAIAAIAREKMTRDEAKRQFTIAFMPKTPPQITYTPGTRTIDLVY